MKKMNRTPRPAFKHVALRDSYSLPWSDDINTPSRSYGRPLPKADDFAPIDWSTDRSRNGQRGARNRTRRRTIL